MHEEVSRFYAEPLRRWHRSQADAGRPCAAPSTSGQPVPCLPHGKARITRIDRACWQLPDCAAAADLSTYRHFHQPDPQSVGQRSAQSDTPPRRTAATRRQPAGITAHGAPWYAGTPPYFAGCRNGCGTKPAGHTDSPASRSDRRAMPTPPPPPGRRVAPSRQARSSSRIPRSAPDPVDLLITDRAPAPAPMRIFAQAISRPVGETRTSSDADDIFIDMAARGGDRHGVGEGDARLSHPPIRHRRTWPVSRAGH